MEKALAAHVDLQRSVVSNGIYSSSLEQGEPLAVSPGLKN